MLLVFSHASCPLLVLFKVFRKKQQPGKVIWEIQQSVEYKLYLFGCIFFLLVLGRRGVWELGFVCFKI